MLAMARRAALPWDALLGAETGGRIMANRWFGRFPWENEHPHGFDRTSPVKRFPANGFGLYDMQGNILQWVEDCFSPSYSGLPVDGSAYNVDVELKLEGDIWAWMNGKSSCSFHICRGGDAWDPPSLIRSAARNWGPAEGGTIHDYGSAGLGFRVAKTL